MGNISFYLNEQAALKQLRAKGVPIRLAQLVRFRWPAPVYKDVYYTSRDLWNDRFVDPNGGTSYQAGLAARGIDQINCEKRLSEDSSNKPGFSAYITPMSFSIDVGETQMQLQLDDGDHNIEQNFLDCGYNVPVEVFYYFPQVDALISRWFGYLDPPRGLGSSIASLPMSLGFRSSRRQLPDHIFAGICPFLYPPENPAVFPTLASIDNQLSGCPFNLHQGGTKGNVKAGQNQSVCDHTSGDGGCGGRFQLDVVPVTLPFGGFDTITINNGLPFAQDSKTIDQARGNNNSLNTPVRRFYGQRIAKQLDIVQFIVQVNNAHPEEGSQTIYCIVGNGPFQNIDGHQITVNNTPVTDGNWKVRLGTIQQQSMQVIPATPVPNWSGHGALVAVQKGDFRSATALSTAVTVFVQGAADVPVYTDPVTFALQYTASPAWCGLDMFTNRWWGMGTDASRFYIPDWIYLDQWFAQTITVQDAAGVSQPTNRSTFNAEVQGRTAQDQIRDWAMLRRVTIPFPFEGKYRVLPYQLEQLDDTIPCFSDRIVNDSAKRDWSKNNILPGPDGTSSMTWTATPIDSIPNRMIITFDDANLDQYAQRPLLFEDRKAQRAAGIAAGDNSLMRVQKDYYLTGITDQYQAMWMGNHLFDLGEFDQGGQVNPVEVTFNASFLDAMTLYPSAVIQVDSHRLDRMTAKYGFKYFRVKKLTQNADLTVTVNAQAYPDQYYAQTEAGTLATKPGGSIIGVNGGTGTGASGGYTGPSAGGGGSPVSIAYGAAFTEPLYTSDGITFKMDYGL